MSDADLIARIESSPVLRRARETLLNEVSFRADKSARLDPMTILMIISIVVQLISFCRQRNNSDAKITGWIRSARTLPRRRTIRLRRQVDTLWEQHCGDNTAAYENNAFFDALLDVGENATDEEIQEILRMAAELNAA